VEAGRPQEALLCAKAPSRNGRQPHVMVVSVKYFSQRDYTLKEEETWLLFDVQ